MNGYMLGAVTVLASLIFLLALIFYGPKLPESTLRKAMQACEREGGIPITDYEPNNVEVMSDCKFKGQQK